MFINNLFQRKFDIMHELFSYHINNQIFSNQFLPIGMPITVTSFKEAISTAKTLQYNVYSIRAIKLNKFRSIGQIRFNQSQEAEAFFKVKAQITQDIYSLFSDDVKKCMELRLLLIIKLVL